MGILFYFIDKLDVVSALPLSIFAFGMLTNFILVMVTETSEEFKRWFFPKAWLALFLLSVMFVFLVPTKETAYKMIIANYVTPNSISIVKEATEDNIASLIDKIAVASQALSGREKESKSK